MSDRIPCQGIAGLLFGHRYEPRMSVMEREKSYPKMEIEGGDMVELARTLSRLTDRTYHGDVCNRCGSIINIPFRAAL